MKEVQPIKGFSKLDKESKIKWLLENYANNPDEALNMLKGYWHSSEEAQKLHDEFIENTISNYYLPFGVALILKLTEVCILSQWQLRKVVW